MTGILLSLALSVLLVSGCHSAYWEKIAVRNDLDFEVALVRCESKSIFSDDIYIKPGEVSSLRSGMTCTVQGPSRKVGPLGGARDNGPYVGCLLMPPNGERRGKEVLVSAADPEVDIGACDSTQP